jgi:hypothetical protein
MSDNDLRLRTAKALGWVLVDSLEWQHLDLGPVRTERYARGDQVAILYRQVNGDQVETTLPLYGASWASCEEIDAECKKRGWGWEARALRNQVYAVMVDLTGAKGFRGMTAPLFP